MIVNAVTSSTTTLPSATQASPAYPLGYIPHQYVMKQVAQQLRQQRYRGAITGPAGCGKTVLLQALGDELMAHGLSPLPLRLDPDRSKPLPTDWRRAIRNARPTDALLLDGYDLLPRWARVWVRFASQRAGAVVVTAQQNVAFKTLAQPMPSPDLLQQLITRVMPVSNLDLDTQAILDESGGNLHTALQIVNQRIQG